MLPTTEAPFPSFFDNDGDPLDEGSIYYGLPNQNPVTAPLQVYWDASGTQPAAQPIKTLAGYPVRFGTPSNVFTDQTYSISVYDKKGRLVYTSPDSSQYNGLPSFISNLASTTNVNLGAALVGYLPPWTNAVGRTLSQRLQDRVDAADFGLKTSNTGAQNNTAIAAAITYANSIGGAAIHIQRGTYNFASSIDITGVNNLRLTGDGVDATVLQINSATADFITCTSTTYYQTIDNLTLTSSVTRTAGAMFKASGMWRRGLFHRVKVSKHFDGLNFAQFEQCVVAETNIVTPSGAGTSVICGTAAASNQGANLTLLDCFLRGNDDTNSASAPVGLVALAIYDCQAVFVVNSDLGSYKNQIMVVNPQTACENCYFVQTFFDSTQSGDNVLVQGAGSKKQFQFTGCWFNGAGKFAPGAADCIGVNLTDNGTYSDWVFSGCRWLLQTGPGILVLTPQADINVSGCSFNNCCENTAFTAAVYFAQGSAQVAKSVFTGCKFISNPAATADIRFSTTFSNGNIITGCEMPKGISYAAGTTFASCAGNHDGTVDTINSTSTLQISPAKHYYSITGPTDVTGINRTWPGHVVTFVATNAFTFINGSNLHLAGGANFVCAANSTLTLMCEPAGGGWREIARHA